MDRTICRVFRILQFIFAMAVAIIYGVELQRRSQDEDQPSIEKWMFAEVVAGMSAVTTILYAIPGENLYCFPWDWLLLFVSQIPFAHSHSLIFYSILWTAIFGSFGSFFMYSGPTVMRSAVWVDFVNMLFWFITAVRGTAWSYPVARAALWRMLN